MFNGVIFYIFELLVILFEKEISNIINMLINWVKF